MSATLSPCTQTWSSRSIFECTGQHLKYIYFCTALTNARSRNYSKQAKTQTKTAERSKTVVTSWTAKKSLRDDAQLAIAVTLPPYDVTGPVQLPDFAWEPSAAPDTTIRPSTVTHLEDTHEVLCIKCSSGEKLSCRRATLFQRGMV